MSAVFIVSSVGLLTVENSLFFTDFGRYFSILSKYSIKNSKLTRFNAFFTSNRQYLLRFVCHTQRNYSRCRHGFTPSKRALKLFWRVERQKINVKAKKKNTIEKKRPKSVKNREFSTVRSPTEDTMKTALNRHLEGRYVYYWV